MLNFHMNNKKATVCGFFIIVIDIFKPAPINHFNGGSLNQIESGKLLSE